MAILINGAGRGPVTAQQDADYFAGSLGGGRYVLPIGNRMEADAESVNTVRVLDGVLVTQGRRIQIDAGYFDDFIIPNGTQGVTSYYIIGYHIYTDAQSEEQIEQFVQASTADGVIAEDSLRDGNSQCYVSLYKVVQDGLLIDVLIPLFDEAHAMSDLPFALAIQDGEYGYINADEEFVPFKKASGTAEPAQVLTGYTFSNNEEQGIAGTMPDRGSVTLTPTGNNTVSGEPGYYSAITANGATAYAAGLSKAMEMASDNVVYNQSFALRTTGSQTLSYTAQQTCLAFFHNDSSEGGWSTSSCNGTQLGDGIYLLPAGKTASVSGSCNGAYQAANGALRVVKFNVV